MALTVAEVKDMQRVFGRKHKIVGILLAFFFGASAYFYTFRKNWWKILVIAGAGAIIGLIFGFLDIPLKLAYPWMIWGERIIVMLDYIFMKKEIFENYGLEYGPKDIAEKLKKKEWAKRSKLIGVALSLPLGPFAWLYCFKRNGWKLVFLYPILLALFAAIFAGSALFLDTTPDFGLKFGAFVLLIAAIAVWLIPLFDYLTMNPDEEEYYGLIWK